MTRQQRAAHGARPRAVHLDSHTACEAQLRRLEAQLHEIRSTLAGLASAAEVLPLLPPEKRGDFEAMMVAELRRLQRIVAGSHDGSQHRVAIDEVVAPLVIAHRARGCTIDWTPTGLTARGSADVVSEALNVLLDNAARHGAADLIRVEARRRADRIEIVVTDGGPGVDPAVRGEIFEWGGQRPDSPGRGIGLAIARERLRACSGDLRVSHDRGATFVADLPAARSDRRTDGAARPFLVR
jgi:signal transduction histidine kinase